MIVQDAFATLLEYIFAHRAAAQVYQLLGSYEHAIATSESALRLTKDWGDNFRLALSEYVTFIGL